MSDTSQQAAPPAHYFQFRPPGFSDPTDPARPNRLCICVSDIHFTDGTVGTQSAEENTWDKVFDRIRQTCSDEQIGELFIILAGDVADMLRSGCWAANGVYPWEQTNKPELFKETLDQIMQAIIRLHAQPGQDGKPDGFFHQLHKLCDDLQGGPTKVQLLALLGNHDRPILDDEAILTQFYEQCLGQPLASLTDEYHQWIGDIYGSTAQNVPWLPFYWGDPGFRLFVTHGHWRDKDNSRGVPGWQAGDGWKPEIWQAQHYAPFSMPCFGDSVAAGMLSGFIWRTKRQLKQLQRTDDPVPNATEQTEIERLLKVLDELDLYRPTYLAVDRIIKEIRRLRTVPADVHRVRETIEQELLNSLNLWLGWSFTLTSAPSGRRWLLFAARWIARLLKLTGTRIELWFLDGLMKLLARLQAGLFGSNDGPGFAEMQGFPAFLPDYRSYGFRIHGEGHTHVALEEELYFNRPDGRKSYTYINSGTWRNQVVASQPAKYRRRGIGRSIWLLDQLPVDPAAGGERRFACWVDDMLSWDDRLDRL